MEGILSLICKGSFGVSSSSLALLLFESSRPSYSKDSVKILHLSTNATSPFIFQVTAALVKIVSIASDHVSCYYTLRNRRVIAVMVIARSKRGKADKNGRTGRLVRRVLQLNHATHFSDSHSLNSHRQSDDTI